MQAGLLSLNIQFLHLFELRMYNEWNKWPVDKVTSLTEEWFNIVLFDG